MRTLSRAGAMRRRPKKYFTTGVYFAAAAAASTRMLVTGELLDFIEVETPAGGRALFNLAERDIKNNYTKCSVIKETGDEGDATQGMRLCASASWAQTDSSNSFSPGSSTNIEGDCGITDVVLPAYKYQDHGYAKLIPGDGIGTVTKPGLCVPIGQPAIHPQTREMITKNVEAYVPEGKSVEIVVSVPDGEKLAENTFDRRLGIEGGISVFETSGTTMSMLNSGTVRLMMAQVDVALALGFKTIAVAVDDAGLQGALRSLRFKDDSVVMTRGYTGEILDYCLKQRIEKIIIIGRLENIMLAAENKFEMSSYMSNEPTEIMKRILRNRTKDLAPLFLITMAASVEDAAAGLSRMGKAKMLDEIANFVTNNARDRIGSIIETGTVITLQSGHVMASDDYARKISREIRN